MLHLLCRVTESGGALKFSWASPSRKCNGGKDILGSRQKVEYSGNGIAGGEQTMLNSKQSSRHLEPEPMEARGTELRGLGKSLA